MLNAIVKRNYRLINNKVDRWDRLIDAFLYSLTTS